MKIRFLAAAGFLAVLPGCAEFQEQWNYRYGPDPAPTPVAVALTVEREHGVISELVKGLGYPRVWADRVQYAPSSDADWYEVILMGFNTVDDACTIYLNNLWKFERQRGRVTQVLAATHAATAGIIGASVSPSAATLTILAQAFGLGTALTDAVAQSYLYTQSPATILKLVKRSTDAYRGDIAKNFGKREYPIASPAAAYFHMRNYLSLCLPPTIQGQIDDILGGAKADSVKGNNAATNIVMSPQ